MYQTERNWITNFIWSIADGVPRDVYVRGQYSHVILSIIFNRRRDAVLVPCAHQAIRRTYRDERSSIEACA